MRILFLLLVLTFTGCITPKVHENPKTTEELRTILQDFHMKLRWGLWDQAAAYASDDYKNEFLGRYEELGDDFKIVNLDIKTVTLDEPLSTVDVEQESYTEPSMVVEKKRYIESWIHVSGMWRIVERIPKKEWRERQKKKTPPPTIEEPSEPKEPIEADAPAEPTEPDAPQAAPAPDAPES